MQDRKQQLRRAVGARGPQARQASTAQRKEELIRALGVKDLKPGEATNALSKALHRGKVVGPPWLGGIFQTRLNVGTIILALGVILFVAWMILKGQVV